MEKHFADKVNYEARGVHRIALHILIDANNNIMESITFCPSIYLSFCMRPSDARLMTFVAMQPDSADERSITHSLHPTTHCRFCVHCFHVGDRRCPWIGLKVKCDPIDVISFAQAGVFDNSHNINDGSQRSFATVVVVCYDLITKQHDTTRIRQFGSLVVHHRKHWNANFIGHALALN